MLAIVIGVSNDTRHERVTLVFDILVSVEHGFRHVTHNQFFHHVRIDMLGDMTASCSKLNHFIELAFDILEVIQLETQSNMVPVRLVRPPHVVGAFEHTSRH